jgi:hypothetical protein
MAAVSPRCRLQGRKQPESHSELIEYLLDTESEEMTFEVARCRPLLTEEFTDYLRSQIGEDSCASYLVACAVTTKQTNSFRHHTTIVDAALAIP